MAEREPTLEELMAELDAGLTLDVQATPAASNSSGEKAIVDDTDTTDFEAELGLIEKKEEEKKATKAAASAITRATAPAVKPDAVPAVKPNAVPAAAVAAVAATITTAPQKVEEELGAKMSNNEEPPVSATSWWSSVKASAEGLISADGIAIDTTGISSDYQRGKEVR